MNEQRKAERTKLIAFTPVYDVQHNILLGYIGDLSTRGAMLIGKKPMEVNRRITLAIGFPETPKFPTRRATTLARVVWCKREQNQQYFNVGFEFQETDWENQTAIEKILTSVGLATKH